MVKKFICCLICLLFSIYSFSQKTKTVDGEYTYVVPENVDLGKAKHTALERLKIQLIADEFGTIISQSNSTMVKNINEKSDINFLSVGSSEVKGEWIETIGTPIFKTEILGDQLVVKVWAKGKIREIISSNIDIDVHILRNGTEDKFESEEFKSGDDLYISLISPINGYVAIYLIDNDNTAFCLLPYQNQEYGNIKIRANERYVFFSEELAVPNIRQYVDEYTMTCNHARELNQIYVVFSPNTFIKPIDNKETEDIPRELSNNAFQKWLSKCRTRDKDMITKQITITLTK